MCKISIFNQTNSAKLLKYFENSKLHIQYSIENIETDTRKSFSNARLKGI